MSSSPGRAAYRRLLADCGKRSIAQRRSQLVALDCAAATNGRGAILIDGEMIDEAGRKQATQIVARGTAAGLMKT